MARAALGWSTQDLAREASVGGNTVNRFEAGHDARLSSVQKMQRVLEAAGITFKQDGCVCLREDGTHDSRNEKAP